MGPIAGIEQQALIAERGSKRIHPFSAFLGPVHSAASYVSIKLGIPGPALTISTGCAGGIDAIGYAFNQVRHNGLDLVVVGAAEAPICPLMVSSLCIAQTTATQYSYHPHERTQSWREEFFLSDTGPHPTRGKAGGVARHSLTPR